MYCCGVELIEIEPREIEVSPDTESGAGAPSKNELPVLIGVLSERGVVHGDLMVISFAQR